MSLIPLIWWKIFEFFTLKKKYWMVTEMCLPFSSIQWDWMSTKRSLNSAWNLDFSEHSVSNSGHSEMFQLTERRIFILWLYVQCSMVDTDVIDITLFPELFVSPPFPKNRLVCFPWEILLFAMYVSVCYPYLNQ